MKTVGVNWASVRIHHLGQAGDLGRDTFEKKKTGVLVVSEPRFRRFWKKALNDFVKGF